jgi:hypothetical protein
MSNPSYSTNDPITHDPDQGTHPSPPNSVAARATDGDTESRDGGVDRERARFGGMKFGSAFFGWLTATGMAVLLTAVLAAIGTAIGISTNPDTDQAANAASENVNTIAVVAAIVFAVIVLTSYYCGGYVAGRMARFDGIKQGVAVWLWAIIVAVVLAIVGLIAGSQADVLSNLNSGPRIPVNWADVTTDSILTALVALVISLAGAILGGLAGMRYYRRIDKAALGR